jgi:hypothetical protein
MLLLTMRLSGSLPHVEEKGGPRKLAVLQSLCKKHSYSHAILCCSGTTTLLLQWVQEGLQSVAEN